MFFRYTALISFIGLVRAAARADRVSNLQALGVLDPNGKPTARLDVVKAANVARLTQEDWQKQRDKMGATCNQCHSANFAKAAGQG